MYKSDYYTKDQMTKYKMKANINKTWLHTLQFFTKLFAQRKAYGDDHAANNGFDSAAHINDIPTNRSLVSTSSDFTTCNLYIESLKELLAAAQEYVAKECTPALDKLDPAKLLRIELDAQQKQFELIMQQSSALLAAMAKGNGSGGGGGGGGQGGNVEAAEINAVIKAPRQFAQTATNWSSTRCPIVTRSQQTRTRFSPGTSPPNQIDRDGSLNSFDINDWIICNKPTSLPPTITLRNYWTPLTSQVKALDPPPHPSKSLLLACQRDKHVHFNLPTGHTDKDSTNYQWRKHRNNDDITRLVNLTPFDARQGVLNSSIPLVISDTSATSNVFLPSAPTILTGTVSTAVFHLQMEPQQQHP
jgi:hypothetical protein